MLSDKEIASGIANFLKACKGVAGPVDLYREAARLGHQHAINARRGTLTTHLIRAEFKRTHEGKETYLCEHDFTIAELSMSLNDFSKEQGWMK